MYIIIAIVTAERERDRWINVACY